MCVCVYGSIFLSFTLQLILLVTVKRKIKFVSQVSSSDFENFYFCMFVLVKTASISRLIENNKH